jgi:hypothetical protein
LPISSDNFSGDIYYSLKELAESIGQPIETIARGLPISSDHFSGGFCNSLKKLAEGVGQPHRDNCKRVANIQ